MASVTAQQMHMHTTDISREFLFIKSYVISVGQWQTFQAKLTTKILTEGANIAQEGSLL